MFNFLRKLTGSSAEPKEGTTRVVPLQGGGTSTLTFRDHRWHAPGEQPGMRRQAAAPETPTAKRGGGMDPASLRTPPSKPGTPAGRQSSAKPEAAQAAQAAQQPQRLASTSPPEADRAAQHLGLRHCDELKDIVRAAIHTETMGSHMWEDPASKAALWALSENRDLVTQWARGDATSVPLPVQAGLRRMWTVSQLMTGGDGKTLLPKGAIEGRDAVTLPSPPKNAPPIDKGLYEAIEKGRTLAAVRGIAQGPLPYFPAQQARLGDVRMFDGLPRELRGDPADPSTWRWHRMTQEEHSAKQRIQREQPHGATAGAGEGRGENKPGQTPAPGHFQTERTSPSSEAGARQSPGIPGIAAAAQSLASDAPRGELPARIAKAADDIILPSIHGPDPHVALSEAIQRSGLSDWQQDAAARTVSAFERGEKAVLFGFGAGTGKSVAALGVIAQMKPKRAVIVVPKKAHIDSFIADLAKVGLGNEVTLNRADSTRANYGGDGIWITTESAYAVNDSLRKSADLIVIDEAHHARNTEGRYGAAVLDHVKASNDAGGKALYMSATPYARLEDARYLAPLGLWDDRKGGFERFLGRHGVDVKETWSNSKGDFTQSYEYTRSHAAKLLGLHEAMLTRGNYLHGEQRLDGLATHFTAAPIRPEHRAMYSQTMKAFEMAAVGETPSKQRMLKAQQQAVAMRILEYSLVPHVVERIKADIAANPEKQHAIFTQSVSDIDLPGMLRKIGAPRSAIAAARVLPSPAKLAVAELEKSFGAGSVATFFGGSGTSKEIAEYQAGTRKLFVGSMARAGTGISLHDLAGDSPRVQHNLSLPYSANTFGQVFLRSHRKGSKSNTEQHWYLPEGIKEAKRYAQILGAKLQSMGAGVRGIATGDAGTRELMAFELGIDPETIGGRA